MPVYGYYGYGDFLANNLYFLLMIPVLLLSLWAQAQVSGSFKRYSAVNNCRRITGAQAAEAVLRAHGVYNVAISRCRGSLTDHYDPKARTLRLSQGVYSSHSIAAVGIAAHEAGHAIQHAQGYLPIRIRMALVPVVQFANYTSWILLLLGMILAIEPLVQFGILLYCVLVLFQLITLPVELDASSRALKLLTSQGILMQEETPGAKAVLRSAAWTYVAALLTAVLQLLRLILIFGGRRNRRD